MTAGVGSLSSPGESIFARESASPGRIGFDLRRVMRMKHVIGSYQRTRLIIDSFQRLLEDCCQDFGALYENMRHLSGIEPHELPPGDRVHARVEMRYFRDGGAQAIPPKLRMQA